MSTWAKSQLDRRRLRQARKAIPDVTWRLPLGYCRNPGEFVLSEGRNYKLFFVLLEANPILPMTARNGCGGGYLIPKMIRYFFLLLVRHFPMKIGEGDQNPNTLRNFSSYKIRF